MFVYGGRALFDGMGKYLSHNGVDTIVDQKDYPRGTFTTAWGVADEAIFTKALEEMDAPHATGKPFYSLVLSVSNHRPFTFPQDHIKAEPRFHRRENVVRYADYALGRFMSEAKGARLLQEHGVRADGRSRRPGLWRGGDPAGELSGADPLRAPPAWCRPARGSTPSPPRSTCRRRSSACWGWATTRSSSATTSSGSIPRPAGR